MEFIQYFGNVFEPYNFAILVLGTIGGLLLGATPGLSPTMTVALLIPFTFHMSSVSGLILLGAAYTSTVAGGAVSAILLKIPGAPANIATALDGHEMAKQNKATKALHFCFISSGVGGILGVFVLIFFTPVLARIALDFGPSQLFWVAILGVTVIATLDSSSTIKGLLSGALGLWLSTIGYDAIQGVQRFAFSEHLEGGIHIIPALIGLFAIPQIMEMISEGLKKININILKTEKQSVLQSFKQCLLRTKFLGIGSIIGIIIGLIPGAGGQIAGLVSWDQARKMSKDKNSFGKGNPDGLIAAESANNAMVGPSLVPLIVEEESSVAITVTPKIATQNNWLGPKSKAILARTGVKKIKTKTPKIPPTPELIKQKCKALVALFCFAISCPSKAVAIFAGAPGIFSKIALTAPPATVEV